MRRGQDSAPSPPTTARVGHPLKLLLPVAISDFAPFESLRLLFWAEGVGFEPTIHLHGYALSKRAHSASMRPLQILFFCFNFMSKNYCFSNFSHTFSCIHTISSNFVICLFFSKILFFH